MKTHYNWLPITFSPTEVDSSSVALMKLTVNLTQYSQEECWRLTQLIKSASSVSSEDNSLIKGALRNIRLPWVEWLEASFFPGGALRVARSITSIH